MARLVLFCFALSLAGCSANDAPSTPTKPPVGVPPGKGTGKAVGPPVE